MVFSKGFDEGKEDPVVKKEAVVVFFPEAFESVA